MPKIIQKNNLWSLFIGIFLIAGGIYTLFNPMTALLTSALFIGVAFLLMGIGYCLDFKYRRSWIFFMIGVIDILIGVLFLTNLDLTAFTVPTILGFWILFVGTCQILNGGQLIRDGLPLGRLTLITGLISLIFGILLLIYPVFGMLTLTGILGGYLIIYGLYELSRYFHQFGHKAVVSA